MQGVPIVLWIVTTLQIVPLDLALLHDAYALTRTPPTSFRCVLHVEVEKKIKTLFQYYFSELITMHHFENSCF